MLRFFKNFAKPQKPLPLGRWGLNNGTDIKSILANHDHCGDTICKDPNIVNEFIEKQIKQLELEKQRQVNK